MSQNEKKGTRRKAYSSKKVVRRSPSCRTGDDGLEYSVIKGLHFMWVFSQVKLKITFYVTEESLKLATFT